VLGAKRLELLRRLAPKATTIAVLVNPSLDAEGERRDVQAAAQEIGQQLIILDVNSDRDIETALQHSSNAGPMRCSSVPALS
jgi:putative tryptophan/tyrosine transport system substrate-binding protein